MNFAIVGCGPGGLATALLLHRQGHKVTLFERFDEPRPVGSGIILQPTGLAVLQTLGLNTNIHKLGKRIDRLLGITTPSDKTVLQLDYSALGPGFHGLAVHRAALFEVLFDAVLSSNIEVFTGAEIDSPMTSGFHLTIDASGASSKLHPFAAVRPKIHALRYGALWGSFDWPANGFLDDQLEQRYVAAHTMIGVLPIGTHKSVKRNQAAFFWSIKSADHRRWLASGLDAWKDEVRSIWPKTDSILQQITTAEQMTLARYGHSTLRKPYGQDIVFVGDAAHSTSPQLGQGANMALLDAWALAHAFETQANVADAVAAYTKTRRWHVRAFQLSSLLMTPFYQSDSRVLAAVRDLLFDPVSKLPIARRVVAGLVSGMLASPPSGLDYSASSTVVSSSS